MKQTRGEALSQIRPGQDHLICPGRSFRPFKKEEIEQSIPERFEEQVARYPQRTAVQTERNHLTYQALNQYSNRIAHAILENRGKGEEPVALLLDQGAPLIAAILGALKAGKMYLPIDPLDPKSRIEDVLEDARTNLVITDQSHLRLAGGLDRARCPVLNMDAIESRPGSTENPEISLSPDGLASLFYTSGSTGRPKGVADSHRNVLHNIMRYTNSLCIGPEDRLTLLQSPSFSGSVSSLFCSLLNGATVFPYGIREQGMGTSLAHWLIREGITIYHSVPMIFRSFLTGDLRFPSLRVIRLEGDAASRIDVELYRKYFDPPCILVNGLGATETGITRQFFITPSTTIPGSLVPIGYAVEDMEVLILSEDGKEVGPGTIGEIAVRSRYLSTGYWRDSERTRRLFQDDPGGDGKRVYRTGDMGRMEPDGCLEYHGRKDFQVKILGHRIEAAVVETALLDLGPVREAAVMTHNGQDGEPRLVAYIVPKKNQTPTVSGLRQGLSEKLPDYMIPSAFVVMDRFPLDTNGKLDRKALPPPDSIRLRPSSPPLAPRDPMERQLVRIWEKCLGLKPVGVKDNFFELGGTSLIAAKIFAQIQREMKRRPSLSAFVRSPTIEHLAILIQREDGSLPESALLPIQPDGPRPPFICVHGHGGGGFFLASLARYFDKDQPFYGIQSVGLLKRQVPLARIESMAAHYIEELRSLRPHGPYYLSGICFGGMVALEMAQQLLCQKEEVAFLALIGMEPADFSNLLPPALIEAYHHQFSFRQRVKRKWGHLALLGTRERISRLKELIGWTIKNPYDRWTWEIPFRAFNMFGVPLPRIFWDTAQSNRYAYSRYIPRVYPGRVTLFLRREIMGLSREIVSDWEKVAVRGVSVYELPGEDPNLTFQEPYVQPLAEQLRDCLLQSQAGANG